MLAKLLIGINFLGLIATCNSTQTDSVVSNNVDSLLMEQSMTILECLDNRKYTEILDYFDDDGVRFSPYAFVDTSTHQKLSANEFQSLLLKDSAVLWGYYDGTGDEILLTLDDYINEFLYSKPFLNAESHKINLTEGSGNSLINMDSVYSNFQYTNHYFSGFNPDYGGMDWQCIRLLYRVDKSGEFRLIAIINDRWTI